MISYRHGPASGDVIYSLPVIRQIGAGSLLLYSYPQMKTLVELIELQPYITSCKYLDGGIVPEVDYNLSSFSNVLEHQKRTGMLIPLVHFKAMKLEPLPGWDSPWLVAPPGPRFDVVLHRSGRYRDDKVSYQFLKNYK